MRHRSLPSRSARLQIRLERRRSRCLVKKHQTRAERRTLQMPGLLTLVGLIVAMAICAACQPTTKGAGATETATTRPERAGSTETPTVLPSLDRAPRLRTLAPPAPGKTEPTVAATAMPPSTRDPPDRARADLAKRLGIDVDEIAVLKVRADEFPASNLGCPGKDLKPMPAFVSGIEIVLGIREPEADGSLQADKVRRYVYRARKHKLVYCGMRP